MPCACVARAIRPWPRPASSSARRVLRVTRFFWMDAVLRRAGPREEAALDKEGWPRAARWLCG
ncbi:hypothetical protein GCM10027575_74260 [Phytohabitans suffuscus]